MVEAKLRQIDPALPACHRVAVEARRQLLLQCRVRKQIARRLLDGELIERHVAVERLNHPLAIPPRIGPHVILHAALAVGESRQIQPRPRPLLAVVLGLHQPVHEAFISARLVVGEKSRSLLRGGQQADQVQVQPADQRRFWRFGRRFDAVAFELR